MGRIVWLASYPKSGNTWTRTFLMNLFVNPREPLPINKVPEMSPSDAAAEWYRLVGLDRPEAADDATVARYRQAVQRKIADYAPDSIFVKTHCMLGPWHGQPLFDPQLTAGAVCIVRNPLDIVASYAHHSGLGLDGIIRVMGTRDYTTPASGKNVAHPFGSWSQNVASWTQRPHPGIHVMRYEDMVADPHAAFGGLMRFLTLPEDADRLDRAIRFASFDELRKQESEDDFVEKGRAGKAFFRKGGVGGWTDELDAAQVARVVADHREQMQRFGYVPEGM